MCRLLRVILRPAGVAALLFILTNTQAATFRLATYNLAGYTHDASRGRTAKSPESKAKARELIQEIRPDIIALQEVGSLEALIELRDSLKHGGVWLPHWELVSGADTNIHLAVLSRFPFSARRPHTNDTFLLSGRRFKVARGFAEVDVQVSSTYSFTLFTAHLKSKRPVPTADESEQRLEEARLLREKLDARLAANPEVNLVVLGDLNDTPASASTRLVLGRGRNVLLDTCPTERGPSGGSTGADTANVSWTYHYAKADTYSRVDYILLSCGMSREWLPQEGYVLAAPDWAVASDHRPIIAVFEAEER